MYVVFDGTQCLHEPQWDLFAGKQRPSPERPSRGKRLFEAAQEFGCELRRPPDTHDFGVVAEIAWPIPSTPAHANFSLPYQASHCFTTLLTNSYAHRRRARP